MQIKIKVSDKINKEAVILQKSDLKCDVRDFEEGVSRKSARWPSLMNGLAFLLPFVATNQFRDVWLIKSNWWPAIFLVAGLGSLYNWFSKLWRRDNFPDDSKKFIEKLFNSKGGDKKR